MPNTLFSQTLHRIPLGLEYLPETMGIGLGLQDLFGNNITFYRQDYYYLKKGICVLEGLSPKAAQTFNLEHFVREKKYRLPQIMNLAETINERRINKYPIQFIKYFSLKALDDLSLDPTATDFSGIGPVVKAGMPLEKNGRQNCVVLISDGNGSSIYMHPKVRADISNHIIGVNHVSLTSHFKEIESKSTHEVVAFAGSFVHDKKIGWVVENTSGHFNTRPTQMKNFLLELQKKQVNIENLTVRLYTTKLKDTPKYENEVLPDLEENAIDFLKRTEQSLKNLSGLYLHLKPKLPEDLQPYKNSFLFIDDGDNPRLYHIQNDGNCAEEKIVDLNALQKVICNPKHKHKTKIHLNMEQIKSFSSNDALNDPLEIAHSEYKLGY